MTIIISNSPRLKKKVYAFGVTLYLRAWQGLKIVSAFVDNIDFSKLLRVQFFVL